MRVCMYTYVHVIYKHLCIYRYTYADTLDSSRSRRFHPTKPKNVSQCRLDVRHTTAALKKWPAEHTDYPRCLTTGARVRSKLGFAGLGSAGPLRFMNTIFGVKFQESDDGNGLGNLACRGQICGFGNELALSCYKPRRD